MEVQNYMCMLQQFLNKVRDPNDYQSLHDYLPQMFELFADSGAINVTVATSEMYCALCRHPIPDLTCAPSLGCWKNHYACSWNCLISYVNQCFWYSKIDFHSIPCPQCQSLIPPQLCEYVLTNCYGELSLYQTAASSQEAQQVYSASRQDSPLHPFQCEICADTGMVEEETTLDCDHRFHKECLKDFFDNLLNDRKVTEKDVACPSCHVYIGPYIIQNVHPQRYHEYLTLATQHAAQNIVEAGEKMT